MNSLTRKTYEQHVLTMPGHFERLGYGYPASGKDVTKEMVEAYAHDRSLAPTTRSMNLGLLRLFLEWNGCELAKKNANGKTSRIWKGPTRVAQRRYWLTKEQAAALVESAQGRERIAILLMLTNGLRSDEVRNLRVSNCRMDLPDPRLVFSGKFDKVRDIAMSKAVWVELLPIVKSRKSGDLVYPYKKATIAKDVDAACRRAVIPHRSPHDLRRTFGRLAYNAGVPLTTIQGIYGHADLSETTYYIGCDVADQRAGMDRFEKWFGEGPGPKLAEIGPVP